MVYKIFFASNFQILRKSQAAEEGDDKSQQMQSVLLFKQMQKRSCNQRFKAICRTSVNK